MLTVMCILAVGALMGAVGHLLYPTKVPLAAVVLLLAMVEALHCIPWR